MTMLMAIATFTVKRAENGYVVTHNITSASAHDIDAPAPDLQTHVFRERDDMLVFISSIIVEGDNNEVERRKRERERRDERDSCTPF